MFQIISDGSCDFSADEAKQHKIAIVPCYITFDEINYLKEGIDIQRDAYFEKLKTEKDLTPKTSQPSPADYLDAIVPFVKDGQDVLVLTMSSKISGSNNSARIAVQMAEDEYEGATVQVVDSLNATLGQGLILKEIIKMRDAGYSLEKAASVANEIAKTAKQYFTLESLEYLKRGGRISATKAMVGGVLGIKPILNILDGEVVQMDKIRGFSKAIKFIEDKFTQEMQALEPSDYSIGTAHILMADEAQQLKEQVEAVIGMPLDNAVSNVGATIGTHTGPGAITISYCKKYDKI